MKKLIIIMAILITTILTFQFSTNASPLSLEETVDVQMETYRESIVIPGEYVYINEYFNNVYGSHLGLNSDYHFSVYLEDAIKIAKGLNPNYPDTLNTLDYEWSLNITFELTASPTQYSNYSIYGFNELGHTTENPVFEPIYFEYFKPYSGAEFINLGHTYANLGYYDLPSKFTFSTNFSSSNPDVRYKLHSITLTAESDNSLVMADSNYSLISDAILLNKPIQITEKTLLENTSNSWRFKAQAGGTSYFFDASIPTNLYSIEDIGEMDLLMFYMMAIDVEADGNRELLLLINNNKANPSPIELTPLGNPLIESYENYHALNLSKGTYVLTKRMTINGIVNKESNFNAYLYTNFEVPIDELLSIRLQFKYRYNYLFSTGDWMLANNIYQHDETSEIKPPRWIWWFSLPFHLIPYQLLDSFDVYNINQIVYSNNIPTEVYTQYQEQLNLSQSYIDTGTNFKIHLGQFRNSTSLGYDIDNIVVLHLTYKEEGKIYEVPYDLIEQNIFTPEPEGSIVDQIGDSDFINGIEDIFDDVFGGNISGSIGTTLSLTLTMISVIVFLALCLRLFNFVSGRRKR